MGAGHLLIREYYLGVTINFMKVAQSSNKHELKLNAAAVSSKHRSIVCGELWHDFVTEYLYFPPQSNGRSLSHYLKFMGGHF